MRRGGYLETRIQLHNRELLHQGLGWVVDCHPQAKVVGGKLQFIGKGPPDFVGLLLGCQPVLFDAKETRKDTWSFGLLKPHQALALDAYRTMGGHSFLIIYYSNRQEFNLVLWADLADIWWDWYNSPRGSRKKASIKHNSKLLHTIEEGKWSPVLLRLITAEN